MQKIAYLLESAVLCGGVKVVLRQAEALIRRGHQCVIVCSDNYPEWFDGEAAYQKRDPQDVSLTGANDWVIGTSPRLVLHHYRHSKFASRLLHLVQGYEKDIVEGRPFKDIIRDAYRIAVPRVTVSTAMAEALSSHYPEQQFYSVGQGLESHLFYPQPDSDKKQLQDVDRVFLVGPLSISVKQIHLGLEAFRQIKNVYPQLKLVRISPVDTRKEEESLIGPIDEYHIHVSPKTVGNIFRNGNGVLLSSSSPQEGFGLPALEAMACGVPVALTDILSYRTFSVPGDYAEFAACDDPSAMSEAVQILMTDPDRRIRRIKRGVEVASQFSYEKVAESLESVFHRVSSNTRSISF